MTDKSAGKNYLFRISVLVFIIAFVVYYYNKYIQNKSIEWTLIFIVALVFIVYLSALLYKHKSSSYFSLIGLNFSVYWTARFFILGSLLIFAGVVLFVVYLYKDPSKLYRPIIALLFGIVSLILGIYSYKFGRKTAKTKS